MRLSAGLPGTQFALLASLGATSGATNCQCCFLLGCHGYRMLRTAATRCSIVITQSVVNFDQSDKLLLLHTNNRGEFPARTATPCGPFEEWPRSCSHHLRPNVATDLRVSRKEVESRSIAHPGARCRARGSPKIAAEAIAADSSRGDREFTSLVSYLAQTRKARAVILARSQTSNAHRSDQSAHSGVAGHGPPSLRNCCVQSSPEFREGWGWPVPAQLIHVVEQGYVGAQSRKGTEEQCSLALAN